MDWAGLVSQYRVLIAIGVAILGHLAAAAIVLSMPRADLPDIATTLPVAFIVFPPELVSAPPISDEDDPQVVPDGNTTAAPVPKLAEGVPEPIEAVPAPIDAPFTALTDLTDENERIVPRASSGSASEHNDGGEAAERAVGVRLALQRLGCRRLVEKPDPACPKGDLFYEKTQIIALREAPPVRRRRRTNPEQPRNYAEAFFARNKGWPPKMLGGEDNALFIDPMREGAYNAERIRNSEAPIWDREFFRELQGQNE